jgi:hypothetical protein
MKKNAFILKAASAVLFLITSQFDASAHIGLGGRIFDGNTGTPSPNFEPIDGQTLTNNTQTVSSSFGWADGTDANWGDSHRLRFFKFTIASTQTVNIEVARRNAGTGPADTFLPAFTLFTLGGAFVDSTHDTGIPTVNYLTGLFGTTAVGESFVNTNGNGGYEAGDPFVDSNNNTIWETGEQFTDLNGNGVWEFGDSFTDTNGNGVFDGAGVGGSGKEGAFRALDPWKIYNDLSQEMHFSTVVGHAADGTSANYGSASGINGDGVADGLVSAEFTDLAAGDYYIAVGGANYAAQNSADVLTGGTTFRTYGIDVTVGAIPEPSTYALLMLGTGTLALLRRNRKK